MSCYCFDLDQTLCDTVIKGNYDTAYPFEDRIKEVNDLYDAGHTIWIFTARGMSNLDVAEAYDKVFIKTKEELIEWGVKHHRLIMGKPPYDHFIDDKAYNSEDWFKKSKPIVGIIAGAFDIIHPGYIQMFHECKSKCTHLIVAINTCPEGKLKPIFSAKERADTLLSLKYVDEVRFYNSERGLADILRSNDPKIDIRFLGDDYKEKTNFTGCKLDIPIHYISRNHGWSTTKAKDLVHKQVAEWRDKEDCATACYNNLI